MYSSMVFPHAIILRVVCPLLPSLNSSCSSTVPLVGDVQFVSKALLANYWDCTARWCCSSKFKLVFPASIWENTLRDKPQSQTRMQNGNLSWNWAVLGPTVLLKLWFCLCPPTFNPFLGVYACVWVFVCSGWDQRIKLRALILYIWFCDSEKTLGLFMTVEMMLSGTNMAKSSYQLHNGQATWPR